MAKDPVTYTGRPPDLPVFLPLHCTDSISTSWIRPASDELKELPAGGGGRHDTLSWCQKYTHCHSQGRQPCLVPTSTESPCAGIKALELFFILM